MFSPVHLFPVLALVANAFVWGVSWWPLRHLQEAGLHPLWSTVVVHLLSVAAVCLWRPEAFGQLWRSRSLWLVIPAAGVTNAAFNWGIASGDVVRVVLLFYLMPLWAVLFARVLLGERLTRGAAARVALALAGAVVVLWPEGPLSWDTLPWPRALSDWLGVIGGVAFALNNVLLRREAGQPDAARALAMFLGGILVAGGLASALALRSTVPWWPAPAWNWVPLAAALGVVLLASNMALQYGAARLPSNVTSVVMLTEVLFATVSALALGGGVLNAQLIGGGLCIVAAAVLAALERPAPESAAAAP